MPGAVRRRSKRGAKTKNVLHIGTDNERIPEPKVIDFRVPWDILNTFLRPLVTNRSLRNEFSGSIHADGTHSVRGAEQVVSSTSCSSCASEFVCMQRASIVRGIGDSAQFFEDIQYTYHTHPTYYYNEYGVKIAPPSGEDIGVFLRGCIEDKSCVHLVVAREGIYYIIPNPCFVHQIRRLKKRDLRRYNIALVGAEILGMQTHECRDSWTPERWLEWVRGRFVCSEILVHEYRSEIESKFRSHCHSCEPLLIDQFQNEFREIVESFQLSMCRYTNPIVNRQWERGNWIDVGFKTWKELETEKGLTVQYSDF
jgi:hypothetical protein